MSKLGPQCPRALWNSVHHPELAEALPPWAEIKYSFGHIIEALTLSLAKAAGHRVEGEQDELELDGVRGHRDAVIDGCTVDVKSASSIGFKKFHLPDYSVVDSFGYLDQLDVYTVAAATDPLVTVKDRAYILGVDKTLGHMVLYEHRVRPDHIKARVADCKSIVNQSTAPNCTCRTRYDASTRNIELAFPATYSSFKYACFPELRTFIDKKGPLYLVKTVTKPDLREVNKEGKMIYH